MSALENSKEDHDIMDVGRYSPDTYKKALLPEGVAIRVFQELGISMGSGIGSELRGSMQPLP